MDVLKQKWEFKWITPDLYNNTMCTHYIIHQVLRHQSYVATLFSHVKNNIMKHLHIDHYK